jgi:hypothetical protein
VAFRVVAKKKTLASVAVKLSSDGRDHGFQSPKSDAGEAFITEA